MDEEKAQLERRYKIAVDARDKLNDNYHKWMTFYYVANGAVLVAITALSSKSGPDKGVFILSIIGVLVCMIWNLSCKGFYYWSQSWIYLIIDMEKQVFGEEGLVYGAFSKKMVDDEKKSWYPLEPANISTPKLTMIFSVIAFLSWTCFSLYTFWTQFEHLPILGKVISTIVLLAVIIGSYIMLSSFVKSRQEGLHKLR